MATNNPKAQLEAEMDASGVRQGFDQIKRDAKGMGAALQEAGDVGDKAFQAIDEGAKAAATSMSRSESAIIASITRATNRIQQAGKTASEAFAFRIDAKGLDASKFEPAIAKLREAEQAAKAYQDQLKADEGARAAIASQQQFIASLREQISLQGKSTDEVLRYRAAQLGIGDAAGPLITQLQVQKTAQAAAAQAARDEAEAQRADTAAKQRAVDQGKAFIAGLQEQVALQGKSQAEILRFRAAQLGVSKDAEGFIASIEKGNTSTAKLGVSAGQTANALRQLPAQFTDIVTSLQGGQAPLTVLLQQGGQIKDSFGGVGAALRAISSLITPAIVGFGAIAGALGVVALAYKQVSDESLAYTRALVLSGNAAGVTVAQLESLARAQDAIAGTQGQAAEALAALATTGRVSAESLGAAADAAIRLARVGVPLEDTVKKFAALGKDPLKALLDINEAENFLTASVFKQVQALTEQGRLAEAAALAQKTYAEVAKSRADELERSLGLIEAGWRGVKDGAAEAWDAIVNSLRGESVIDRLKAELENYKQTLAVFGVSNGAAAAGGFQTAGDRDASAAKAKAAAAADQARSVAALASFQKEYLATLSKTEQTERALTAARNQYQGLVEKGLISAQQYQGLLQGIRAKFADQGGDNELAALRAKLKTTNDYIAVLSRQGAVTRELNEGEKQAALLREQLQGSLTATTRAEKERALALATQLGQRQRLADGLKADIDLTAKLAEQTGQQADAIRQKAADQEAANAAYGQGRSAIEALALAELKKQALDLEATNSTDPRYLANLYAKIEAQKRFADSLKKADFKTLNQGAEEWLRTATEAARLQAAEPAMLALSAAERQKITADRAVDLELSKKIAEVDRSGLDAAEKALLIAQLRAAASKDRERNEIAAQQAALREVTDFLDPARAESFGSALAKGFEAAGSSLAKMNNALADFARQQREIAKQQQNVDLLPKGSFDQINAQNRLNEKSQQSQIGLYASLTGAAKGFFGEGTRGYKALEAAETAFRLVQLASNLAQGLSAAAVGIANQAKGDPYSAFPRMAAMAAAMAALGFAVGFGGGGGSTPAPTGNPGAGTGTVLGDVTATSDSISKSIDQLASTAKLQLTTQGGMLASLRNIESSIGGLAALVVRGSTLADSGVQTGTTLHLADPITAGLFAKVGDNITTKIFEALFGKKVSVTGQGLAINPTTLGQAVSGGLNLQNFTDVHTSKKLFGITYSSSDSTNYSQADAQLQQQFGQVFKDLYSSITASATPLGQALDQVQSRLDGFVLNIGRIELSGLTGQQIQDKLTAVIGAAADSIAQAAIPGLQDFEKVGEGYFETLVRVASGVETAKADLDLLGIAAINFGDVTRKQGDVAAEIVRQSIALFESADGSISSVGSLINGLDASADELASTYKALVDVRDMLISVGESGDSLTASLIQGAGGLDGLQSSLSTYLQNFFTDQERAAAAMGTLTAELGRIGITSVPQSREAFRALVEGIDKSTESGQRLYGQVLGLAGAFDEAQTLAEKAGTSVVAAASRLPDILKGLLGDRDGLAVDLLKAQGDTAGAAALARQQAVAKLIEGLSAQDAAAATAAYDFNDALRAQIATLNDATTAAQQAAAAEAQRAAAIQQERTGLEGQVLQLQGNTAELRARELAALDPSNRALQEFIYLLTDQAAAQQAATQAADAETQRLASVAAEREGLQGQVDQLQGNTAAIRARELAALDPTNRALQEFINLLTDQAAAQQAATQAAEAEAQRLAAVASQRDGIQAQIDQLLGDTAAVRARELAALDPSNRALQERYYALVAEKQASDAATQAAQEAAQAEQQRTAAIASERDNLVTRLLTAQGDTAALRARELAALDESNRSLLERIFALEDAKTAEQAATEAAQQASQAAAQAAQAAEQLRAAWQGVVDGLLDEVRRLRGVGGSPTTFAEAQSRFAIASAQARAGDQDAAKLLPSLSQALIALAQSQATSAFDLNLLRARTAASLSATAALLQQNFGLAIPKLATGTNEVPHDMFALLHKGEAVVPRAYNPAVGGINVAQLLDVMEGLRADIRVQAATNARTQRDILAIQKNWELNGLPETRIEAAA